MMSAKAKHCFDQYQKNFTLAIELEEKLDDDGGWSCVVRFYAALHLINAYLIDKTNLRFDPLSSDRNTPPFSSMTGRTFTSPTNSDTNRVLGEE